MAWRAYVDPTNSQWYITDDAGNFLPYGSDGAAAQAAAAQRNGSSLPSPTISVPSSSGPDWSGLWGALTGSNQQQFDWQKQQFGQSLTEQQREFNLQNQLGKGNLWSSLLQNLLGNATQLANLPANWLNYANYTSGAKNIFDLLSGSKPVPAFQAPSAGTPNNSLEDVLRQLGLISSPTGAPSTGTVGTAAPGTSQYQVPANWLDIQTGLDQWWNNGEQHSNDQSYQRVKDVLAGAPQSYIDTFWNLMLQQNLTGGSMLTGGMRWNQNPVNYLQKAYNQWLPTQQQAKQPPQTGGGTEPNIQAPLPYQINPMVWDSMSDTAKQVILASVQQGNTPSGYWSPTDYLNELNASRPLGIAPRRTSYNYQQPQAYF